MSGDVHPLSAVCAPPKKSVCSALEVVPLRLFVDDDRSCRS
jgi:hypothetical protein